MELVEKALENIEGKGENAGTQQFLFFPQLFIPLQRQILSLQLHRICCPCIPWNMLSVILLFGIDSGSWKGILGINLDGLTLVYNFHIFKIFKNRSKT